MGKDGRERGGTARLWIFVQGPSRVPSDATAVRAGVCELFRLANWSSSGRVL